MSRRRSSSGRAPTASSLAAIDRSVFARVRSILEEELDAQEYFPCISSGWGGLAFCYKVLRTSFQQASSRRNPNTNFSSIFLLQFLFPL
jgi:hypothetical protein